MPTISLLFVAFLSSISIKALPQICFAPCNVRVTLTVTPSEDNRTVRIEFDGTGFYRQSEIDFQAACWENEEGKRVCRLPQKTTQITYPAVPAGDYYIRLYLFKKDNKDNEVDYVRLQVMPR